MSSSAPRGCSAWLPVLEQVTVSLRVRLLQPGQLMGFPVDFPTKMLWAMLNPDGYGNPAHQDRKSVV